MITRPTAANVGRMIRVAVRAFAVVFVTLAALFTAVGVYELLATTLPAEADAYVQALSMAVFLGGVAALAAAGAVLAFPRRGSPVVVKAEPFSTVDPEGVDR